MAEVGSGDVVKWISTVLVRLLAECLVTGVLCVHTAVAVVSVIIIVGLLPRGSLRLLRASMIIFVSVIVVVLA